MEMISIKLLIFQSSLQKNNDKSNSIISINSSSKITAPLIITALRIKEKSLCQISYPKHSRVCDYFVKCAINLHCTYYYKFLVPLRIETELFLELMMVQRHNAIFKSQLLPFINWLIMSKVRSPRHYL